MLNEILNLKKIRVEMAVLKSSEKELEKPMLDDFSFIPTLYGWFLEILENMTCPPNPDSAFQRKKFLFVAVMLYSPATFCGKPVKEGLCAELAKLFNLTPVSVSRNISGMIFYYENYRDFADGVEKIYVEILHRLKDVSV
ncbi:MAG: hypothetical protein LBL07_10460 [Tannerella sp.]|jgi:hypothetical protein|nr:hypothetical protein [Tannerella sp.]